MQTSTHQRARRTFMDRRGFFITALILVLCSTGLIWNAIQPNDCVIDEPSWITSGYLGFSLLTDMEPLERWEESWDEYQLGSWGNQNPPLGKYFIGAVVSVVKDDGEPVRFRWCQYDVLLPPPDFLAGVRVGMALIGSLALFFAWLAAFIATRDPVTALVAPLYLYFHGTFQIHATTVHTDIIQLVFLLAATAALFGFVRKKSASYAILAATAAGFSCAAKFSSAPIVPVIAVAAAFCARGSIRHRASLTLATLVIPVAVFVAVNPYLYDAPIDKTLHILHLWKELIGRQAIDPALVDHVVHSRLAAIAWIVGEVVGPDLADKILAGLAALCLWVWLRFGLRPRLSLRATIGLIAALVLVMLLEWQITDRTRVMSLLWPIALFAIVRSHRSQTASERAQDIVVCGAALFVTGWVSLWLPFYWPRYSLPPIALGSIVLALGATRLVELLRTRFEFHPDPLSRSPQLGKAD